MGGPRLNGEVAEIYIFMYKYTHICMHLFMHDMYILYASFNGIVAV